MWTNEFPKAEGWYWFYGHIMPEDILWKSYKPELTMVRVFMKEHHVIMRAGGMVISYKMCDGLFREQTPPNTDGLLT